ncbi:hypothetical protein X797_010439 [Metarhizium robertsii]|uniref:Uncharacterized protein n=2 Tax=Metarhizium robertsii TaxID=568076 RepID=E9FB45_METRA|nr:uncharacterized protein MAA_09494 [Metarhizium robertsii ARSEF 23]EFY95045.1 hypothetical protein MAA_09494 [Metarhizium robertsii ARSEF 23]EXU96478.1 hypothetical protein X797_010439 [Metarhizium robertsii]
MAAPTYYSGTVVKIGGNVAKGHYTVQQEPLHHFFQTGRHGHRSENKVEIDFSIGPVGVKGYIDITEQELVLSASVLGIPLGTFTGSLKTGITIDINLLLVRGILKFYIKDSTLYLDVDLKLTWDGEFKKEGIPIIHF